MSLLLVTPGPPVEVSLVDGPDELHGRLIVTYNNQTGTVCRDNFGTSDARVVCRMLGYKYVNYIIIKTLSNRVELMNS